jgi:hypothetical protein
MTRALLLFSLLVALSASSYGQEKIEREFRTKESEVPEKALKFTQKLQFEAKQKWYREDQGSLHSIELKSKLYGKQVSIEFDTLGKLLDVEFRYETDVIPEEIKLKIEDYWETKHDRFKIFKLQIQLIADEQQMLEWLGSKPDLNSIPHNYEFVLRTSTSGSYQKWEYQFDQNGSFISRTKFKMKSTDVLEY